MKRTLHDFNKPSVEENFILEYLKIEAIFCNTILSITDGHYFSSTECNNGLFKRILTDRYWRVYKIVFRIRLRMKAVSGCFGGRFVNFNVFKTELWYIIRKRLVGLVKKTEVVQLP